MRGLLFSEFYRPIFSGHETFALRQLWLKKAVDLAVGAISQAPVYEMKLKSRAKNVFSEESSIIALGVGKNMVASMRHWATACDVLNEVDGIPAPTKFGSSIFGAKGLDPYSEHPATLWLIHWKLAGGWALPPNRTHRSTTWFWVFNYIHEQSFSSQDLLRSLGEYAEERSGRLSLATLKRDVEVCLRSYIDRSETGTVDDFADSMLGELGLLTVQTRDEYALRRGPKATLSTGAFLLTLLNPTLVSYSHGNSHY